MPQPSAECRVRPADSPGYPIDAWFNVFVLHQNRVAHSQNAKNCIREGYLARFLDFVIWGHEHECISEPWVRPHLVLPDANVPMCNAADVRLGKDPRS